jgi:peptidoglycan/LPS O-acetylase OafA/YrhL
VTGPFWTAPRIADRASGRDNNFNLLRIIAAIAVLISHTWLVALGPDATEPLQVELKGITLGTLSVMAFFSISGFFITRSFEGRISLASFLQARCLRLFPALIVVLAVTVLVAGVWLTTEVPGLFWREAPEYYMRNLTLFFLKYDLPGVFMENPYGPAINGSLWTLNYEVLCYTGVVLCGVMGVLTRPNYFVFVLICFAAAYTANSTYTFHSRIYNLMTLGLPFVIGMSFWVWRSAIPLSATFAVFLLIITFFCRETSLFRPLIVLFLSYTVFVVGYAKIPVLAAYNRVGDYSYGTYIYAFPIQQTLASYGIVTPLANMALALPLTLFCAVMSWHLVEAPAMRLKSKKQRLKA